MTKCGPNRHSIMCNPVCMLSSWLNWNAYLILNPLCPYDAPFSSFECCEYWTSVKQHLVNTVSIDIQLPVYNVPAVVIRRNGSRLSLLLLTRPGWVLSDRQKPWTASLNTPYGKLTFGGGNDDFTQPSGSNKWTYHTLFMQPQDPFFTLSVPQCAWERSHSYLTSKTDLIFFFLNFMWEKV